MNDGALDPIIQAAQTTDLAVRLTPVTASFGNRVVVLCHNIVDATICRGLLGHPGSLSLPFKLSLANGVLVRLADPGASTGSLELARWRSWWW